jgi:hypothetical protein
MKKSKKQAKPKIKAVKKPLSTRAKKMPLKNRSRLTVKKIVPKKTRAIVSKKVVSVPIENIAAKIEKEINQKPKIRSHTEPSRDVGNKWQILKDKKVQIKLKYIK